MNEVAKAWNKAPHGQDQDWRSKSETYPKAPGHRLEFEVSDLLARSDYSLLQCHPTDWTGTRMILLDLRVHRAGVNRAVRWVRRGFLSANTYALVGLDSRLVRDHDVYLSIQLFRWI